VYIDFEGGRSHLMEPGSKTPALAITPCNVTPSQDLSILIGDQRRAQII